MDPFEEFEFKPLTDGLGFHKKQKSLRESVKEVQLEEKAKPSLPTELPEAPKAARAMTFEDIVSSLEKTPLKKESVEFSAPLPREPKKPEFNLMDVEIERPTQSPFPTPETYKRPFTSEPVKKTPTTSELSSVGTRRGATNSPKPRLVVSPGSLSSAILDVVVVLALGLIFTSALLSVTGVELQTLINSANYDLMTQISVGVLIVAVMQIYFIISRAFFGCTLGEWTFDLQLGKDEEYKSESYPLRVILRSLLVTLTGVIVLPVISFLIRRDIAGKITGLNLYVQKN